MKSSVATSLGLVALLIAFPAMLPPASAGELVGGDLTLYRTDDGQYLPAAAYNSLHDEFLVVFEHAPGSAYEIRAVRLSGTGAVLSAFTVAGGDGVSRHRPDVAYDPVGGEVMQKVRRTMAWDGRLLVIGFVGGIPDLPANHILLKNYSVVGVHWGASLGRDPESLTRQMGEVLKLAEAGPVDPLIFEPYSFENGAQAVQDLADRKTWGKVIVST